MDLILALIGLLAAIILCFVLEKTLVYAFLLGLVFFSALTLRRGHSLAELLGMYKKGFKQALPIAVFILLIGCITSLWRASGTVSAFVVYGVELITPSTFLFVTFIFSVLMSYAIGSAFGVSGTLGVIFMTLAASSGVSTVLTGGVILSGIYFGDRCSPVSANYNMMTALTNTTPVAALKKVMQTGAPAFVITLILYAALSFLNPLESTDRTVANLFTEHFSLSPWVFLPALLMLILPLLKVPLHIAISINVVISALIALFVQNEPLSRILCGTIFGYEARVPELSLLNGGGLLSMAEVVIILTVSCIYSSIFSETRMLLAVEDFLTRQTHHFGRFPVTLVFSIVLIAVFSNPTISILLITTLLKKPYEEKNAKEDELLMDLVNSVSMTQGFIPWAVSTTAPIALFGGELASLAFAFYLYLVPLCYLFTKKLWYKHL